MRYYDMFRKLAEITVKSNTTLVWIANNNFERAYIEYRLGIKLPFIRVLRPLGVVGNEQNYEYPPDLPPPSLDTLLALNHSHTKVFHLLDEYTMPLLVVPNEHARYGGPATLRQFKAFLEFPYQVSTMKLYENLAAGVVMVVPAPQLLEEIWKNGNHKVFYFMQVLHSLPPSPHPHIPGFPAWSAHMDYYSPTFAPYIYYFKSFEELRWLGRMDAARLDWRDVREKRGRWYDDVRGKSREGWRGVWREMGYIWV
ncbi:hypothetical protein HDU98_011095 [Podochytrium sp. JEL0797]|nr:hypothetical protein HDU98_011095 [Podochytrium sp. JEL0797]